MIDDFIYCSWIYFYGSSPEPVVESTKKNRHALEYMCNCIPYSLVGGNNPSEDSPLQHYAHSNGRSPCFYAVVKAQ